MTLILGIDEAGRGPVLGPLVLCGYMIEEHKHEHLKHMGVKDSKLLTPEKRSVLVPPLKRFAAGYHMFKVSASDIDTLRGESNLNIIEIDKMRALIETLKPDRAIIDAPEVNTKAFASKIRRGLSHECEIIAENFADKNHPEVGAASILAKVARDREIRRLHGKYGDFGSGYPHDVRTIGFLKDWLQRNNQFPACVRSSWMTAQALIKEKQQTRLGTFA